MSNLNEMVVLSMITAGYIEKCPIVSTDPLPGGRIRIRMHCHKDYEYMNLPSGERVKRGVQFGKKIKELLTHGGKEDTCVVQFKLVDSLPSPEEYIQSWNFDPMMEARLIRTIKSAKEVTNA